MELPMSLLDAFKSLIRAPEGKLGQWLTTAPDLSRPPSLHNPSQHLTLPTSNVSAPCRLLS